MISIPPDHKYATLALDVTRPTFQFTDPLEIEPGLLVTRELPLAMPDHWQTWLGSLRVEELTKANLFVFATSPSSAPKSLDAENKELAALVHRLYFGLLVAVPYIQHQEGTLMTGAHHDGQVDVREVTRYDDVVPPAGCYGAKLGASVFQSARRVAEGIASLEGTGEHSRIWRITHAFYDAMRSNEFGLRLHQCVRSIEGFVLPDIGSTRKQMISRSTLFMGSGFDALMGKLFDIRSAVEHLHGPYAEVSAPDDPSAQLLLAEFSFKAEAIARYCLDRLFTTPSLWAHFADDNRLRAFWKLNPSQRSALWGGAMDSAKAFAHFSTKMAAIEFS